LNNAAGFEEVKEAIVSGQVQEAKHGRKICIYNFKFDNYWILCD
jgi:ribosomal protein L21